METHLITEAPPPPMMPPTETSRDSAATPVPAPAQSWSTAAPVNPVGWVPMALLSVASTVLGAVLALLLLAKINNGVLEYQSKPGASNAASAATAVAASSELGLPDAAPAVTAALGAANPTPLAGREVGVVDASITATVVAQLLAEVRSGISMTAQGASVDQAMAPVATITMQPLNVLTEVPVISAATATLVIASGGAGKSSAAKPTATPTASHSPTATTVPVTVVPTATPRPPRSSRPTPTLIIAGP